MTEELVAGIEEGFEGSGLPDRYKVAIRYADALITHPGDVAPEILDRCRERIESLITGRAMPAAAAGTLTPAEQTAVDFAEQYMLDVRGFTEADDAALHAHFTDAQLTTLTFAVATFDAAARTALVLSR